MAVCSVHWCVSTALPGMTVCRLHDRYPAKHAFEAKLSYLERVREAIRRSKKRKRGDPPPPPKPTQQALLTDAGMEPDVALPASHTYGGPVWWDKR